MKQETIAPPLELKQFFSYCEHKYGFTRRDLKYMWETGIFPLNAELYYWIFWVHRTHDNGRIPLPFNFRLEAALRAEWIALGDVERNIAVRFKRKAK